MAYNQPYGYGQQPQYNNNQYPQQPPYGGHQPNAYNPPPGQPQYGSYGAPAPPAPHQGYNQPPPSLGYGQPQHGYGPGPGAPPQPNYGAHPSHQLPYGHQAPPNAAYQPGAPAYGAPPPTTTAPYAGAPIYLGARLAVDPLNAYATVPPSLPDYNPAADVEALHKATKGFGTNENAIHRVLCVRTAKQIQVLAAAYKGRYGKDLIQVMKKETSGNHERVLVGLVMGPLDYDVEILAEATHGVGTKETTLTEMVIGRNPQELTMLRAAYEKRFRSSFDQMVAGELSFKTKDAFMIALQGRWEDNGHVDPNMLHHDVSQLANNMRLGFTDELLVCSIIFRRSPTYIQALCNQFKASQRSSLTKQIKQHFSGHLQDALLYAVEGGKRDPQGIWRDAKMLEKAMAGVGTKDHQLIYRLIRAHWDRARFEQIKHAYQMKYRKSLVSRVKGETSGHYEDALVAIIEGR